MNIDLTGKVVLVTGAGGHLGRYISRTLAACGADVALHYHSSEESARRVAEQIEAEAAASSDTVRDRPVRTCLVRADVGSEAEVFAMRDTVAEALGAPDIVVSNAVAQYQWTTVLEQGLADYESQFRSCVLQNVLLAKAFVPAMQSRQWGRIIAINTECAMQNTPMQSAYVSGKRGMDGVLRVLAREVGEYGITVNQVAPGWMITDGDRAAGTERQEEYEKAIPLRHRGQDQDIANAVAFLASDLAAYITGVYLPVCGGNVMPAI